MSECNENKQCPMCAEDIRVTASICHYCGTALYNESKVKEGYNVKVRIKTGEKIYTGDIYIYGFMKRVSEIVNDKRPFISLANTFEEVKSREVEIGYIAINKMHVDWVREVRPDSKETGEARIHRH